MQSVFLNLLTFFVAQHLIYPGECSICAWEECVFWFCWIQNMSIKSIWYVELFKSIVSLSIFCLDDLSNVKSGVMVPRLWLCCCLFLPLVLLIFALNEAVVGSAVGSVVSRLVTRGLGSPGSFMVPRWMGLSLGPCSVGWHGDKDSLLGLKLHP